MIMTEFKWLAAGALLAGLAACGPLVGTDGGPVDVATGDDACGAAGYQTLVGTSVGTLDPSTLPEPRRIIFPGQSVTMDLVAERFNVEIGPDDLVARVYCG
jgi:hypothetical protein